MHPKRKQRLMVIGFLMSGLVLAVGLVLYALQENINLFYGPSQIANGEAPLDTRIRAGGMVEEGSVNRDQETLAVNFRITDFKASVPVTYEGILPDLFKEGQGVVALGRLREDGVFVADEVLAKHDENYMPPEVAEAMERAGGHKPVPPGDSGSGYGNPE